VAPGTRRVGPLVKPKGAIAIDTSRLTAAQVVRAMERHIIKGTRP
jgi:cytidylate kinase